MIDPNVIRDLASLAGYVGDLSDKQITEIRQKLANSYIDGILDNRALEGPDNDGETQRSGRTPDTGSGNQPA